MSEICYGQERSRDMNSPTLVSVILPLFGSHRGTEAIMLAANAWLEQDVPCGSLKLLGDALIRPQLTA